MTPGQKSGIVFAIPSVGLLACGAVLFDPRARGPQSVASWLTFLWTVEGVGVLLLAFLVTPVVTGLCAALLWRSEQPSTRLLTCIAVVMGLKVIALSYLGATLVAIILGGCVASLVPARRERRV